MGRIVQRTFSGSRIDWEEIPASLTLTAFDLRTGERWALDDVKYWIRQPIWNIFDNYFNERG